MISESESFFIRTFDPGMDHPVRTALLYAAMICAPFFAILICVAFLSCAPTSTAEPEFIGRWAADSAGPGLVALEFNTDHTARFSAFAGAQLVSDARGTWEYDSPQLIVRHSQCQAGMPLVLIACPNPDTLRAADISGDAWRVSLIDSGIIITYQFRRVK